jgi:hypothetical protein
MLKYNVQQIKFYTSKASRVNDGSSSSVAGLDNTVDEIRNALDFIQENALGKAIELSAVPTATEPLLQDGEWGVYAGLIYYRVSMTIYVITPSSTITVS